MENDQLDQNNLFTLTIDNPIKVHLVEAAKWGRFLAIVGFIFCAIFLLAGLSKASSLSGASSSPYYDEYGNAYPAPSASVPDTTLFILLVLSSILYFFPCLFMLRFSNKIKLALLADDQERLTDSFRNLKLMFRFVGIITLIFVALYLLLIIFFMSKGA